MLFAFGIDLTAGTELEVLTMEVEGMKIEPRNHRPQKIIIDWSGNEMTGQDFAAFLAKGKTGCHLYIDYDGGIWQFADLFDQVVRKKEVDGDSIWIVLQNKGVPPEDPRYKRGTFREDFHGRKMPVLGSVLDQLTALEELIALICESVRILPIIPRVGEEAIDLAVMEPDDLKDYVGLLLASHVDARTMSPGPGVIELLDEMDQEFNDEDDDDSELEDEEGFTPEDLAAT